jgi:hypothetical protein
VIRNAVVSASRMITDFRVVQTAPNAVTLTLPPPLAAEVPAARQALQDLFARHGARPQISTLTARLSPPHGGKLRRVTRSIGSAP